MRYFLSGLTVIALLISSPVGAQEPEDFLVTASSTSGTVGGSADVSFFFSNASAEGLAGYQFGVCHDASRLDVTADEIDLGAAIADLSFTFELREVYADAELGGPGWTGAGLFNVITMAELPPGDLDEIYVATYSLLETGVATVEWCETLGLPAVANRLVYVSESGEAAELAPLEADGEIRVDAQFRRGDVDGNGVVEPIVDTLFLLDWAFIDGPGPGCLSAADVNDDGGISATGDAIYLLSFGFSGGAPPPAPGSTECGGDERLDDLGCLDSATCE